jgi:hypothetical protein
MNKKSTTAHVMTRHDKFSSLVEAPPIVLRNLKGFVEPALVSMLP